MNLEELKRNVKITEDESGKVHVDAANFTLWFSNFETFRTFAWCMAAFILDKEKPNRGVPERIREAFEKEKQ